MGKFFIAALGVFGTVAVHAAAPPPTDGETVIIQPRTSQMVEEFRINGRLVMIKIKPRKGPPYYLIDTDGDGVLDSRQDDLDPNMPVPSWVILRW